MAPELPMTALRLPQSFVLPWSPTAKGRPRTAVRGGHAIIYTPERTRNAEAAIRLLLMERKSHYYPRGVPVSLHVVFGLSRPNEAPRRETHPPRRPDLTNYLMLLADAGTGVLWEDDSQLVMIEARKEYVGSPRIIVTVGVPMASGVAPHMLMSWERTVLMIEAEAPAREQIIGKPTVGKMEAYREQVARGFLGSSQDDL